jgi:hypothetical protein
MLRRPISIRSFGRRYTWLTLEASRLRMRIFHWITDQLTGPNSSVEDLAHSIPCTKIFPDPAAQLTDDLLEAMGDLCRIEEVNPPPPRMYSLKGKLRPTFLLHCQALCRQRRLSLMDLQEDVGGNLDNWSFPLFLQIVRPCRS